MTEQKPKIFLSYAHENIGIAKRIYHDLKRYGLDVWFDKESLLPGQDWENEIEKAIETSEYFLVLLSSKGMSERGYVHKEIRLALDIFDKCPEGDIFLIPVRLDDCQPAHRRIKQINWINLFPKSEYQNGLKKILQVVCKDSLLLRNKPKAISEGDATEMIRKFGFYDKYKNSEGEGFNHKYELQKINGDKVVFDQETELMWQQDGSDYDLEFDKAKEYITELNEKKFAGFNDWRLPTLEEAMSLMEPEEERYRYINPIFDNRQSVIWTADEMHDYVQMVWVVDFSHGTCGWDPVDFIYHYARAVRSIQSSEK
jgi:hypothetical protein